MVRSIVLRPATLQVWHDRPGRPIFSDQAAENGRAALAETWSCPVQEFQRESEVIAEAIKRMNAASQPAEA